MGVVHELIQDGIRDGLIADQFVPVLDGELAGHDGGGASLPVVEDLQEITPLLGSERRQTPVIQDQELDARQRLEEAAVASITVRGIEQAWHAMVEDGTVVAAGLMTERAGNKTLADAGLPDNQHILMTFNPIAGDEPGKERLVEPARHFQIDVLNDGRLAQPCAPAVPLSPRRDELETERVR